MEDDSFFEGLGRFPGVRRHLLAALQTGQVHRLHARQAQGAAGGVHGDVAAADHQHVGADGRRLAAVDLVQKLQAGPHARGVLSGNAQLAADPRAGGHEDGVEPGLQQTLRIGNARAGLGFDAQVQDVLDFLVQHVVGEAIPRNAVAQHAAQARLRLEEGHAVARRARSEAAVRPAGPPPTMATFDSSLTAAGLAGGYCSGLAWM